MPEPGSAKTRVLLVSYYFPPDASVGGLRLAKFARALPDVGLTPVVLTSASSETEQGTDRGRLQGLEHVRIVATADPTSLVERLQRLRTWWAGNGRAQAQSADGPAPPHLGSRPVSRLKRYVLSLIVYLPDEKKHWALRAAFVARGLVRSQKIDCVLTSGPPFSSHAVGVVAKLTTGVRWVADFRDPWVEMLPDRFPETRSRLSDWLERRMETIVVRMADVVVTTTDRMRVAMTRRYPWAQVGRFLTVENSIDSARLTPRAPHEKYPIATVTYAGSFYFDRTPEPVFQAVADLIQSGAIGRSEIRIQLIGRCESVGAEATSALAARYGIAALVDVRGVLPYDETIQAMQRSHALLVLAPRRHALVIPAKVYDYLGTGTPILALAEDGATADLLRDAAPGGCFRHDDITGIKSYLARLVESRRGGAASATPFGLGAARETALARYDVAVLTRRLATAALVPSHSAAASGGRG